MGPFLSLPSLENSLSTHLSTGEGRGGNVRFQVITVPVTAMLRQIHIIMFILYRRLWGRKSNHPLRLEDQFLLSILVNAVGWSDEHWYHQHFLCNLANSGLCRHIAADVYRACLPPVHIPWSPKWSDTKRWFPLSTSAPPAYAHSARGAARVLTSTAADDVYDTADVRDKGARELAQYSEVDALNRYSDHDDDGDGDCGDFGGDDFGTTGSYDPSDGLLLRNGDNAAAGSPERDIGSERVGLFGTPSTGRVDIMSSTNDPTVMLSPARALAFAFTSMADGLLDVSAHELQLALPDICQDM